MELWVFGHGELPGSEQTFVPAGTNLVYYVKSGFVNSMPNALAELSVDGAVHGLGHFEERQEYGPGEPVPNHRLGEFSTTEINNVYQVLWAGQDLLFIGQGGLYDRIKLCAAPNSCVPPLHTCTGLLGDARIVGRKIHLTCCRGSASDLMRNTPPLMRDEYGPGPGQYTNYAYDKAGELHQMMRHPGGSEYVLDELQSMPQPVQAMTLASSVQLAEKVQALDSDMTRIRSGGGGGGGGWLDPRHLESLPGVWQGVHRKYHPKARVRLANSLSPFPVIAPTDCPPDISACVNGAWYPVFVAWYWHERGSKISKPLLRFDELAAVRAMAPLLARPNLVQDSDLATSDAFWAISDFFDLLKKTNADLFVPEVASFLAQGERALAKFTDWDEQLRDRKTRLPEPVTPGDPRIKWLREATQAVGLVARSVLTWRNDAHRRFCTALQNLTERDVLLPE